MLSKVILAALLVLGSSAAFAEDEECEHPTDIIVKGSFDKSDARKAVKPVIPKVEECYNKLLKKDKTAQGRITITSYIKKNGRVEKTEVCASEKLKNKRLFMCIKRRMRRAKYPSGITPAEVQFPMDLSAK